MSEGPRAAPQPETETLAQYGGDVVHLGVRINSITKLSLDSSRNWVEV